MKRESDPELGHVRGAAPLAARAVAMAELAWTVGFADIDAEQIVWHGHYARYFEQVRGLLLDRIGYGYAEMRAAGLIWPVVDMHVRFVRPLRYGDTACITAGITEWRERLRVEYEVRGRGEDACRVTGYTLHYPLRRDDFTPLPACPEAFVRCVEAYA